MIREDDRWQAWGGGGKEEGDMSSEERERRPNPDCGFRLKDDNPDARSTKTVFSETAADQSKPPSKSKLKKQAKRARLEGTKPAQPDNEKKTTAAEPMDTS